MFEEADTNNDGHNDKSQYLSFNKNFLDWIGAQEAFNGRTMPQLSEDFMSRNFDLVDYDHSGRVNLDDINHFKKLKDAYVLEVFNL